MFETNIIRPQSLTSILPEPGQALAGTIGTKALPEENIFGFNSRDQRSRPFNLLRSQLLKTARSRGWRLIGVTSATPRVGKSFIASNLAAALARTPELHTYLLDLDLRRSTIAKNFGLQGDRGIADFLDGEIEDLRGISWNVEAGALTIVPSFSNDVASAEVLAGPRMDALIAAMRALPEGMLCILDLPPVFANDDAVIIAQKIDAYILVVQEGATTVKQVRDSFNLLQPAPCLGTVLNHYNGGLMGDDYGYGYGQSGKYAEYYK
ncbi:Mrp family chromosome partitioning ATPase [Sphingomonas jejuensis]|uniref:Mrp family chromosome partitioning ATPase n=1 Tax=Sphingomonas jejuensis TaxID=904715 RepID=A0ABX0XLL4_9SPHN|nr:Mrp family chromosome partitioning ATPase [Sphingomonas jejuensis]